MAIERLMLIDSVSGATYFAVNVNNQDYRLAIQSLLEYMQDNIVFPESAVQQFTTQYAAPSSTGFSVTISAGADATGSENVHLILTPTAGFAAGTIVLPLVTGLVDKQEVLVNCTQQVTTLTINANGATAVTGEPTSLGADDFFRLKFDLPTATWYRIG